MAGTAALVGAVIAPLGGLLGDRIGFRPVLLGSLFVGGFALLAVPLIHAIPPLAVAILVFTAANGLVGAMVFSLLATEVPAERRSQTLNLVYLPLYAAGIIGPLDRRRRVRRSPARPGRSGPVPTSSSSARWWSRSDRSGHAGRGPIPSLGRPGWPDRGALSRFCKVRTSTLAAIASDEWPAGHPHGGPPDGHAAHRPPPHARGSTAPLHQLVEETDRGLVYDLSTLIDRRQVLKLAGFTTISAGLMSIVGLRAGCHRLTVGRVARRLRRRRPAAPAASASAATGRRELRRDPRGDRGPVPGRRLQRPERPRPERRRPQRHPLELRVVDDDGRRASR